MRGSKNSGRQRTRRVPVALPTLDTAPANWLRSIRLSGFTIAALTLIVLTVVVLAPSLRILIEQRQQVAQLQQAVSDRQEAVDNLTTQKARWDDPSYIQSLARERLDYVYPGEYTFLLIDDEPVLATSDGLPISADIQTTEVDWVSSLLSSVLTAGLTDAPADEIVAPILSGLPSESTESAESEPAVTEPAAPAPSGG